MIIKLPSFILSFLMLGCAMVVEPSTIYIIKNEVNLKLYISFFKNSKLIRPIEIPANGRVENRVNDRGNTYYYPTEADSIVTKWSDGKGVILYCGGKQIFGNYINCKSGKSVYDTEFLKNEPINKTYHSVIFTEEDYKKAKPL